MTTKRCLFSYEPLSKGETYYSEVGLKTLSKKLHTLNIFPYTAEQQRRESQRLAGKMSIQGVQPKLSVILNEKKEQFEITERGGHYIVKPAVADYPELPENEDVTMDLAAMAGIEVPWHGLIQGADGRRSYIIRRFDRKGKKGKVQMEDFAQLIGASRSTKYLATTERAAEVIEEHCTFPTLELLKFYRLIIFSFMIGNEDLHLKNLSLITDPQKIRLSPAYDLVNSTIALANPQEELALELKGKKHGFHRSDFIEHLGTEICYLPQKKATKEFNLLVACIPQWKARIQKSFLSAPMKSAYLKLIDQRAARLV